MTESASASSRRRRLRFSLRTFLVLLTVGCLALGYWAYREHVDELRLVRAIVHHLGFTRVAGVPVESTSASAIRQGILDYKRTPIWRNC